jgi:hypothetical protein
MHFGPRSADWTAEIVSDQGRHRDGWYRYGVHFPDLTRVDVDLINDSVFSLVVPDLFATLRPASWSTIRLRQLTRWVLGRSRARSQRRVVPIPVRVQHGGGTFVATTRDVSATGVGVNAPMPIPDGARLQLSMYVPGRTVQREVTVARCRHRPSRFGFDTWILGMRFQSAPDAAAIEAFRHWEAA